MEAIQLQFITHYTEKYSYLEGAYMALEGGCRWIQLRMKESTAEEIESVARKLQSLCKHYKATFIIDDHVELTKKLHADGVHLGKKDMPIREARSILGSDYLIGGTANTFEDICQHWADGADYIGCGPFRYTSTKTNLSPLLGLDGYKKIVQQIYEVNLNLPIVAIGGITVEDIPNLMQSGINGIALSGTVLKAEDPVEEMRRILKKIQTWKN